MVRKKWDENSVRKVLESIEKGLTLAVIAARFDVSRNAIVGLWYRLRNGEIYPELAEEVEVAAQAMQARHPQRQGGRKRKAQIEEQQKKKPVQNKPVCVVASEWQARKLGYPPFKKPLTYTGDPRQEPPDRNQCAFIENDEETWWYCKHLTRTGSSYCPLHHEVVYVPAKRGARKAQDHEAAQGA